MKRLVQQVHERVEAIGYEDGRVFVALGNELLTQSKARELAWAILNAAGLGTVLCEQLGHIPVMVRVTGAVPRDLVERVREAEARRDVEGAHELLVELHEQKRATTQAGE